MGITDFVYGVCLDVNTNHWGGMSYEVVMTTVSLDFNLKGPLEPDYFLQMSMNPYVSTPTIVFEVTP